MMPYDICRYALRNYCVNSPRSLRLNWYLSNKTVYCLGNPKVDSRANAFAIEVLVDRLGVYLRYVCHLEDSDTVVIQQLFSIQIRSAHARYNITFVCKVNHKCMESASCLNPWNHSERA